MSTSCSRAGNPLNPVVHSKTKTQGMIACLAEFKTRKVLGLRGGSKLLARPAHVSSPPPREASGSCDEARQGPTAPRGRGQGQGLPRYSGANCPAASTAQGPAHHPCCSCPASTSPCPARLAASAGGRGRVSGRTRVSWQPRQEAGRAQLRTRRRRGYSTAAGDTRERWAQATGVERTRHTEEAGACAVTAARCARRGVGWRGVHAWGGWPWRQWRLTHA